MAPPSRLAGPPGHLVRRFFSVLGARPLDAAEQQWVAGLLTADEVQAFWAQPTADLRHAHDCAYYVADRTDRLDLIRAALLHDIGKRHARLGAFGRSLATISAAVGLPLGDRFGSYTRHGPVGAAELAGAGAEPLVVGFTDAHHGPRPSSIAAADWELLKEADRAT